MQLKAKRRRILVLLPLRRERERMAALHSLFYIQDSLGVKPREEK
jgi:hypothetical protein